MENRIPSAGPIKNRPAYPQMVQGRQMQHAGLSCQLDPKRTLLLILLAILLIVSGCATAPTRNAIPESMVGAYGLPGIDNVRFWGDETPPYTKVWLSTTPEKLRERFGGIMGIEHHYLCISGGGANGAFGAGLLVGWTDAGTRPDFTVVTGISTGALAAPFAFLGSDYDSQLKEMYTTYSTKDLVQKRGFFQILKGDAFAGTDPLKNLLAKYIDETMMQDLADEYRKGRQLNIGTTNLDAGRPVVWNVTRIAASGHPRSLELIRQILLASAAIPGAFPPVYIKVEKDGQVYDEMHVDGGATSQVFFYPADAELDKIIQKLKVVGKPDLYVIRNSWIDPYFVQVEPKLTAIAGRSISSLIRTQGIGDMYRLYVLARRDGLDYKLAYIPADFKEEPAEQFDPVYMGKLFDRGYQMAVNGYPWQKVPPGLRLK